MEGEIYNTLYVSKVLLKLMCPRDFKELILFSGTKGKVLLNLMGSREDYKEYVAFRG